MTDNRESDCALVDTCEDIIRDIDQAFGADISDDSQTVGLRDLHLESVSSGDSETPASHGNTPKRESSQKQNTNSDNTQASQASPGATLHSGLQASNSLSANLAMLGSQHSSPILPSTPDGTRNDPVVVSDGGGSTSTELYASEVSDMSQDDVYDLNNNNNDKSNNTQTPDLAERAPEDTQNSSGSSGTLVNESPPGSLDPNTPGGLGGPSGSAAAVSGTAADQPSGTASSGTAASGTAASRAFG